MTLFALVLAVQTGSLKLPSLFSDHMVLERGVAIPVFGTATPGSYIEVDLDGQSAAVQAASDGKWAVNLRPMTAGGPYTMNVTGDGSINVKDVMIGEVWVASGQSNMEFREENALDFDRAKTETSPMVRMFTVSHKSTDEPQLDVGGDWQVAGPSGIGFFSAVGYSFAAELQRQLKIPIGIIHSSWGGTEAEAWTSHEGLESNTVTKPIIENYLNSLPRYPEVRAEYEQSLSSWNADRIDRVNEGVIKGWAAENTDTSDWKAVTLPKTLRQIEGPYVNGAFWFRRSFDLPDGLSGKTALLELGPIDNYDRAYINGVQVGFSDSEVPNAWVTPRSYTVASGLLHPGKNTVAVRVFSTAGVGGFTGTASQMQLIGYDRQGPSVPLDGDWEYKPERIAQPAGPPPTAPVGPGSAHAPGGLFNAMIAPLTVFPIKGVIWYQGEANTSRAAQYRDLFPTLIQDWRNQWNQPSMPFYFVQLPNFQAKKDEPSESSWAELREAQALALKLPETGMATIIDLGSAEEIHPREKREVGRRLAINVLKNVYHAITGTVTGPVYKTVLYRGNEIWVRFDATAGSLKTTDGQAPTGFAVAGPDHKYRWADAHIRGDWVILSSPDVPNPKSVRYGWADNPDVNLVNAVNLPATPFRTDDPTSTTSTPR